MRKVVAIAALMALSASTLMGAEEREDKRLESCGKVFGEIMNVPEGAPRYVLDRADCIISFARR